MPLKLNVGISKKIGQPDYGSLGASCNVELELDCSADGEESTEFQKKVKAVYSACRRTVEAELARRQAGHARRASRGTAGSTPPSDDQSDSPTDGQTNGHAGHGASERQLGYIQQLAAQIRGLRGRRLEALCQKMFEKPLNALSSLEASGLIDLLKGVKAGRIELAAAKQEAAA